MRPGVPDNWTTAGNAAVHQALTLDRGRSGGSCARLECTEFTGDGPDYHAMLCQVGRVAVRKGQWYRLAFSAKAERLKAGSVEVALTNTRPWENVGLSDAFTPAAEWAPFEILFRASADLPAANSRLQLWFKGTGTLWVDDVTLEEYDKGQQWFPQVSSQGVKNFLPNSSFECGGAGWGSFTYGLSGWAGNLYRLEGEADQRTVCHGRQSLKIELSPKTAPVFYFDYYDPVRQPVRRVLVANRGWVKVVPKEALTLSAWLKADTENAVAQLLVNEAPSRIQRKSVRVGREWARYEFTFSPNESFLFVALGLDLEESGLEAATLWVDAVQLERGERATAYEPRQPVESFIETGVTGNVFTNPTAGLSYRMRAFNNAAEPRKLTGKLRLTDFSARPVFEQERTLRVPANSAAMLDFKHLCRGQQGYFHATWNAQGLEHSLRSAQIMPSPPGAEDSPIGFNHAYPWDFLVQLARQAGVLWWRDWSAKWQTVEPERGRFNFAISDAQISRVRELDNNVEVLLPFPSAAWSTTAKAEEVEKAAGNDRYLRARMPVAYAPANLADFGNYAASVARRYARMSPRPVTHFQILNEPVYTSYALPRQFGYSLADYLRLLEVASKALRAGDLQGVSPRVLVVGGISAGLESGYTKDFVAQGGLRLVDVFDLHMYDAARSAESFETSFRALEELMREHGGPKPVWITEWGCYADDDPPSLPQTVGDATMNRCRWPSERAATEHIVKFAAVSFAHGVRKIFFHAGTCGPINGSDAGGVLFEYGGAPRKMYPGVAALNRLLSVPEACVDVVNEDGLHAYLFRGNNKFTGVGWSDSERVLRNKGGVEVFDIMGNPVRTGSVPLHTTPVYVRADSVERIRGFLR